MTTAVFSTNVNRVIIREFLNASDHVTTNVKKVFDAVMDETAAHRSVAMDKIASVLTNKLVAASTDVLHILRIAVTVGSLGIISPTRLPVFFARVAKGVSMIYEASKPEVQIEKAFTQGGAKIQPSKLQLLADTILSKKQQKAAKGVAIITAATLEAACLPIAIATAMMDAACLAYKHKMINVAMPAIPFHK